jgi:hypothetical protein
MVQGVRLKKFLIPCTLSLEPCTILLSYPHSQLHQALDKKGL